MSLRKNKGSGNELDAHYSFVRGCLTESTGNERSAMAYYRREIRATGYFKAHFNLARLLTKRRRIGDAIDHYRAAARSANTTARADALNNLGLLYWKQHKVDRALECFDEAGRLDRRSAAPRVNAALACLRRGDTRRGMMWLRRAEKLRRSDPETDAWLAYASIEHGLDIRKGVRTLERAAAASPLSRDNWLDLAVGYFKLGDRRRGTAVLKKVTSRSPLSAAESGRVDRARNDDEPDAANPNRGYRRVQ